MCGFVVRDPCETICGPSAVTQYLSLNSVPFYSNISGESPISVIKRAKTGWTRCCRCTETMRTCILSHIDLLKRSLKRPATPPFLQRAGSTEAQGARLPGNAAAAAPAGDEEEDEDDEFVDVPSPAPSHDTHESAASHPPSHLPSRRRISTSVTRATGPRRPAPRMMAAAASDGVDFVNVAGRRVVVDRLRVAMPGGEPHSRPAAAARRKHASGAAASGSSAAARPLGGQAGANAAVSDRAAASAAVSAASAASDADAAANAASGGSGEETAAVEERRRRLMAKAPVVPYGVDLEYWGKHEMVSTGESCVRVSGR